MMSTLSDSSLVVTFFRLIKHPQFTPTVENVLDDKISEHFSTESRIINAFDESRGFIFIGDIIRKGEKGLRRYPHIGDVSIKKIKKVLNELGLSLEINIDDWQRPKV